MFNNCRNAHWLNTNIFANLHSQQKAAERKSNDNYPNLSSIQSLLTFGSLLPSQSPWVEKKEIKIAAKAQDQFLGKNFALTEDDKHSGESIISTVDSSLEDIVSSPKIPVVLFSGGIDSSFIAWRLKACGRNDTVLFHYSKGSGDIETEQAKLIAKKIGLKIEIVYPNFDLSDTLLNPGKIFGVPFCDSTTPQNLSLIFRLKSMFASSEVVVVDGTGADGLFGLKNKSRIWSIFARLRFAQLVGRFGSPDQFLVCSKAEKLFRISRRQHYFDYPLSFTAQNPLGCLVYKIDGLLEPLGVFSQNLSTWAESCSTSIHVRSLLKLIAADLIITCSSVFSRKVKDPLSKEGYSISFPFMSENLVNFAVSLVVAKSMPHNKLLLKRPLYRQFGGEFLKRKKAGFPSEKEKVFHDLLFLEFLKDAKESETVRDVLLDGSFIDKAHSALYQKKMLPIQTLNFLWSLVFVSRWYKSADRA